MQSTLNVEVDVLNQQKTADFSISDSNLMGCLLTTDISDGQHFFLCRNNVLLVRKNIGKMAILTKHEQNRQDVGT